MITNIFLSILEISLSVSLIVALLLLFSPFLIKRYAAKWKYWVWILLAIRLIIPINVTDVESAASRLSQMKTQDTSETVNGYPDVLTEGVISHRVIVEIPVQMTTPIYAQTEKNHMNVTIFDIAAIIWLIGCLTFIAVNLLSYFRYKRQVIRNGVLVDDEKILYQLSRTKRELHLKRSIPVIKYSEVSSPMIIGFIHPTLVLQEEQYSSEELYFILKHELIHLKRRDVYFKLLLVLAKGVHWFNPFIWIMQRQAVVDMELSCDERVTQGADYSVRKAYTETLLSTLHIQSTNRTVLSTQFYGGKEIMKKRFKNILVKTGKEHGFHLLIVAVVLTITLGGFIGCSVSKENTEDSDTNIQPASIDYSELPGDTYTEYISELGDEKDVLVLCGSPAMGQMNKYVFFSSDGGKNWTNGVDVSQILHNYPVDAIFVSSEIGFILTDYHGYDEFLYKTTDAGKSWEAVDVLDASQMDCNYINGVSIFYDNGELSVTLEKVYDDTTVQETYFSEDMGESWMMIYAE